MDGMNFGDILRDARERSGEDLLSVARRLRIRPDILQAIENNDLDAMPPRGYSRNMVNAYARYVGLNPTEIVKMYLDAQYNRQMERARANVRASGFDMSGGRGHRDARSHERERRAMRDEMQQEKNVAGGAAAGRATRSGISRAGSQSAARTTQFRSHGGAAFDDRMFDDLDPEPRSRPLSSAERAVASRPTPPASVGRRAGAVHVGSYNAYGQGLSRRSSAQQRGSADRDLGDQAMGASGVIRGASARTRTPSATRRLDALPESRDTYISRGRRSLLPEQHSISATAAPRNLGGQSGAHSKLPFVIAGVIILLLVVLIAVVANGLGRASTQPQETTPMNITGLPESSASTSADASSDAAKSADEAAASVAVPPTKVVVAYSVASGQTPYLEIYEGESESPTFAGNVEGPAEESFDVTSSITIVASPYDGLTVTQDGVAVDMGSYVNENGLFVYEVSFADVLQAWSEAHPSESSSTAGSSGAASTSGSTGSAGSSSASTGSAA